MPQAYMLVGGSPSKHDQNVYPVYQELTSVCVFVCTIYNLVCIHVKSFYSSILHLIMCYDCHLVYVNHIRSISLVCALSRNIIRL